MEPERPIEKLLRAFAKKRRDDAGSPLELHPADRRLLQGEVARQTRDRSGGSSFFRLFAGRRLAFALSAIAITGIGAWLLVPAFKEQGFTGSKESTMREMSRLDQPATTEPAAPAKEVPASSSTFAKLSEDSAKQSQSPQRMAASGETFDAEGRASPAGSAVANSAVVNSGGGGGGGGGQIATARGADIAAADEKKIRESAGASPRSDIRSTNIAPTEEQLLAGNDYSLSKKSGADASAAPADTLAFKDAVGQARLENETGGLVATTGPTQSKTESASLQPLPAAPPPAPSTPMPITTLDLSRLQTNLPGMAGAWTTPPQRFVQVSFNSSLQQKDASQSGAVLTSFDVQRNGRQIRVVDQDGSVYSGEGTWSDASVRNEAAAARTRRLVDSQDKALDGTTPEQLQNFTFTVSGTNARLKQPIAFTGRWTVLTNPASFAQKNQTLFLEADSAKALTSATNPPTQILGTLTIGNSNSSSTMMMNIQAVPVGR